jgi:hypothetical protein
MNVGFWQKHQSTPFDDAIALLRESHGKILALIDGFTNEELFEKKRFPWTGTTNIGTYCVSVTASHYDWAMKKIKQYLKTAK